MLEPSFAITVLPYVTVVVMAFGFALRLARWFIAWKEAPVMGKVAVTRHGRFLGVVENWTVNMLPPRDLAAKYEPGFYVVGVTMHLSFIALLLTNVHEFALLKFLLPGVELASSPFYVPKPWSHVLSAVFLVSLLLMILRRIRHWVSGRALRAISSARDFVAAPLLWLVGLSGFLASIAASTWPYPLPTYIITLHIVIVQVFLMYVPFSKFIHGVTVFIVRTLFGVRRAEYGV